MVLISLGYLCGLKFTLSDKYFFSPNEIETFLRKKGLATASKKSGRVASEGLIGISLDDNMGAIVEVNSETDVVARNQEFQEFVISISF